MISSALVWAVVLRHLYVWKRDLNVMLFGFYWPMLDILIWGFLGAWIQVTQQFHNYESIALLGVLLWQIVGRGCNIMANAFCEELWTHNVVNLFSLPLRTIEWMLGVVLFYIIMMAMTTTFCMLVIAALYDVSMWNLFSTFLIFAPPLIFSGIWLGFTGLQIIVSLGKRGVELGYVIGWFLMPFSGAFYSVEILPHWAQVISSFLPMSYVFQGMRGYLMLHQDPTANLLKGYILSILYAACALILFIYFFNRSKRNGLARLTD
jgi:ABC-2 type transport system permease protein